MAGVAIVAFVGATTTAAGAPLNSSPQQNPSEDQYAPDKATICHRASTTKPFVTLTVPRAALPRYLRRGATVGPCVYGFVRPGGVVTLRTNNGQPITVLKPRRLYSIVVSDPSRTENFHLYGQRPRQAHGNRLSWHGALEDHLRRRAVHVPLGSASELAPQSDCALSPRGSGEGCLQALERGLTPEMLLRVGPCVSAECSAKVGIPAEGSHRLCELPGRFRSDDNGCPRIDQDGSRGTVRAQSMRRPAGRSRDRRRSSTESSRSR